MRGCTWVAVVLSALAVPASADAQADFHVARVSTPPLIDGQLTDEAWNDAPLDLDRWISYNPLRGEPMAFKTDVRIVYDSRFIYFAFHCFDTEASRIRTTISRRDNVFNDDWVALSLDSTGTGQTAYHLFVNPSGIQMDALNTASGERFEADLLWDSAGAVTEDGYVVEIRLPLQTIRFSGGDQVSMGILFFRRVSRTGVSASWPEMAPGQWVFDRPGHLLFSNLTQPPLIELLPSATYGISQLRASRDRWEAASSDADIGLSGKYGITSNVTFDGTLNPDFSQVESDAFQVDVNQRFPIFYSEKRPFFMEGMGLFDVAGTGGDGNMRTAVHTRRIIDPFWGSKLTGTIGKAAFGLLNASDESPQASAALGDSVAPQNKFFSLGRLSYSLGQSNYVGAIFTDTEHVGRHNRVIGGDLSLRLSAAHSLSATFLSSDTGLASGSARGTASQATYRFNNRRFSWSNQIEHYDEAFRMDTAFFNRTGFTAGWSYGEVNFYPREGQEFWLKRISPFYFTKRGVDRIQNGDEWFLNAGIRFNFTRQGFVNISHARGVEPWAGQSFETGRGINFYGQAQILRWLRIGGGFNKGLEIFYDPVNPFQGSSTSPSFNVTLQPDEHFNQGIDYDTVRFNRVSDGTRVFTVHIVNLKATYQFDRHFLVRLIEQYDSSNNRLLTDFLASYEFVPGTVLHGGYGSLYEKRVFEAERLLPEGGDYLTVSRGLFFKASYRHRF
ncbi:MAG TPA: DUF5916 domain-containing protein [Vicinamibacterales bacterium]|nr:DUF5916 domain-containing protein [Vicinamibacterales bacterium]